MVGVKTSLEEDGGSVPRNNTSSLLRAEGEELGSGPAWTLGNEMRLWDCVKCIHEVPRLDAEDVRCTRGVGRTGDYSGTQVHCLPRSHRHFTLLGLRPKSLNCLGIPLLPTVDNAHVHMCFGPSL